MRTTLWSSTLGDIPANMPFTNNYAATTNPGVSNDSTQNYSVGSQWVNISTGTAFSAISVAPGAAVWAIDSNGSGLSTQGAPASQDTAATLTAAQLQAGIITSNPAAAIALTLPLATAMDTALPQSVANNSFDFSVINLATVATDVPTLTASTGWTTVGNMSVAINTPTSDATPSSGRFRARKTGAGAWVLYRIS